MGGGELSNCGIHFGAALPLISALKNSSCGHRLFRLETERGRRSHVFQIGRVMRQRSLSFASIETQRRLSLSATAPVVLLPANGSSTRPRGFVRNLMKNSGSPTGILAGCGDNSCSRQYRRYGSLAEVFENVRKFEGMAPALSVKKDFSPMWCSDGLRPALYFPVSRSFSIDLLYGLRTCRLSAYGFSLGDIHHRCVYKSFTRTRSTFTHCAGVGRRVGLWQMNCWHKLNSPARRNARRQGPRLT